MRNIREKRIIGSFQTFGASVVWFNKGCKAEDLLMVWKVENVEFALLNLSSLLYIKHLEWCLEWVCFEVSRSLVVYCTITTKCSQICKDFLVHGFFWFKVNKKKVFKIWRVMWTLGRNGTVHTTSSTNCNLNVSWNDFSVRSSSHLWALGWRWRG